MVSLNVGRKLGDSDAWDAFLDDCRLSLRQWEIIFVCECDGVSDEVPSPYHGPHLAIRHWPGPGSWAMTMVINTRIRRYFKCCQPRGRAMRIHLRDSRYKTDVSVIGLHGGHGAELGPSLADASSLIRSRKRGTDCIVLGDFNVDQLPVLAGDPWSGLPGRAGHHSFERNLLHAFCERFRLSVEMPKRVVGECAGEHRLVSALCPLTRIPTGEQLGVPSLLDYGLASPGIILDSAVDWEIAMADHGAYCCEARISVQHLPQR